jgi:hypothetical protein
MSRTTDTDTSGKVDLNNADGASGDSVTNVQRELNGQDSFVTDSTALNTAENRKPTWSSDAIGSANQAVKERVDSVQGAVETNQTNITANTNDVADIRTTTGTSDGDTDMGTFTGSIITDNVDTKTALQELETALEPILDGLDLQGSWNATTNTPTLTSSVGTKGHFYVVTVAGSTNLDGITDWEIGDWAIFDGSVWFKSDNSSPVASVFSRTGAVVAATNDYTWAQIDKTVSPIDDLSDVDTTTTAPLVNETLTWDGSNWVPGAGGGGSGEGGINYITNSQFEVDVSDWSKYDDGAVAIPVDGTGGVSTLTLIHDTVDNIRGTGSFKVQKGAVPAQGEGVSIDFTIDDADLGKSLNISFDYLVNLVGYASDDVEVYVYDVTNANMITPSGDIGLIDNFGGTTNTKVLQFQAASDSNDYRLIFHITNTSALAYDIIYDNVKVGPDTLVPGAIITEWESFTPTGTFTTNTTYTGRKRRVGDTMECMVRLEFAGAPNATTLQIHIPDGLTLDSSKWIVDTSNDQFGKANYLQGGVANEVAGGLRFGTTTQMIARYAVVSGADVRGADVSQVAPFTIGATDEFYFRFSIPILEWSAGAMISTTENFLQNQQFRGHLAGNQAIGSASPTKIAIDTAPIDTHNLFDAGNNRIVIAKDGNYLVSVIISPTSQTANEDWVGTLNLNGVIEMNYRMELPATGPSTASGTHLLELKKGDYLELFTDSQADPSYSILGGFNDTSLSVMYWPEFSKTSVFGESEVIDAGSPTQANWPFAASTWGDLTSITLTPGEWDIVSTTNISQITAGGTFSVSTAISTISGTGAPSDAVFGESYMFGGDRNNPNNLLP